MDASTEQDRRDSMDQALANTRIEGHVPTPEFLADCERFVRGEITQEDIRAASLARARNVERVAAAAASAQVLDAA